MFSSPVVIERRRTRAKPFAFEIKIFDFAIKADYKSK